MTNFTNLEFFEFGTVILTGIYENIKFGLSCEVDFQGDEA